MDKSMTSTNYSFTAKVFKLVRSQSSGCNPPLIQRTSTIDWILIGEGKISNFQCIVGL
uniref:Uncharacterized protein n=1 Tax=Tetranychus urticae TaxID=32264 RepID=T1KD05_TETUR